MFRAAPVVLAVALATAGFAQETSVAGRATPPAKPASVQADIRGVWRISELAWRTPGAEWEIRTPYLSQYIFTGKHYSYMYASGAGPRKLFAGDPNRPTDAEKVEAYNSFVAASGTYTLAGQTLTLRARVHKNPNEMTGHPLTYTIAFDGDALRMVIANPPFLPGRESRTVLTRIE
jgi:hypothetical protein